MSTLTLGSLFDGSGGFPLAALMNGITPVWASEIEPFPIRVTTKRLPFLKHYGDISRMDGAEIEPVDIISFGSPCTNLSVAGRREGLEGKQSSLFFQAIRIIKEMRKATHGRYPRFIVWENVPGAYSSASGRDFQQVLTEIIQIKDEALSVPMPEKGKWLCAGEILGDGHSLAWRTLDAQYWGVAQRRRRCYLVADFDGECAGKILFESEGVSGHPAPGGSTGQATAGDSAEGIGKPSVADIWTIPINMQIATRHKALGKGTGLGVGEDGDPAFTLQAAHSHAVAAFAFEPGAASRLGGHNWENLCSTLRADAGDNQQAVAIEHYPKDSRMRINEDGIVQTLTNRMGTGGNNVPLTLNQSPSTVAFGIGSHDSEGMKSANPHAGVYEAETSRTLDRSGGNPASHQGGIAVVAFTQNQRDEVRDLHDRAAALAASPGAKQQTFVYAMTTGAFNSLGKEVATPLMARDYKSPQIVNKPQYTVRKLTPQECAMLQGFPVAWCAGLETPNPSEEEIDWWVEVFETHRRVIGTAKKPRSRKQIIKWLANPYSDAAEYKLWGNGVALPCVCFVMAGIVWASKGESPS